MAGFLPARSLVTRCCTLYFPATMPTIAYFPFYFGAFTAFPSALTFILELTYFLVL